MDPFLDRTRIIEAIKTHPSHVFSRSDLRVLIKSHSDDQNVSTDTVVSALVQQGHLEYACLPGPRRPREVYLAPGLPSEWAITCIDPNAYLSHYSAASYHGLHDDDVQQLYVNVEQKLGSPSLGSLDQHSIDRAFGKAQRVSNNRSMFRGREVVFINGKYTGRLGVVERPMPSSMGDLTVRVTDIERTLLDIATRPAYAGGPEGVLKCFQASAKEASADKLLQYLLDIKHVYPFHQVLGYYLERSGFDRSEVAQFHKLPIKFNFYLTHQMDEPVFIPHWQLFVPATLEDSG